MSWSAHQRRLLDALGYELLVPGRVGTPAPVAAVGKPAAHEAPAAAPRAPRQAASPLQEALRRAAGGSDPMPWVSDLEKLRGDPAGKRALWPRLRALRKGVA
jgi:hypothetical protein